LPSPADNLRPTLPLPTQATVFAFHYLLAFRSLSACRRSTITGHPNSRGVPPRSAEWMSLVLARCRRRRPCLDTRRDVSALPRGLDRRRSNPQSLPRRRRLGCRMPDRVVYPVAKPLAAVSGEAQGRRPSPGDGCEPMRGNTVLPLSARAARGGGAGVLWLTVGIGVLHGWVHFCARCRLRQGWRMLSTAWLGCGLEEHG
jgi:hypothetical protein